MKTRLPESARMSKGRAMSDYDTDILTWAERQADLLRRVGVGAVTDHSHGLACPGLPEIERFLAPSRLPSAHPRR
jgi:hypothetical protein